jgi:cell division topological specificity factor MinE
VDLTPAQIEQMRSEIMEVIGRYVEYEEEHCRVSLERHDNKIALVSTVPVRRTLERATA